jgi:predicted site-specific integrase-resolvase
MAQKTETVQILVISKECFIADLKAVIYARYSTSNQREKFIEVQIRECTKFAEQNG